MTGHFKAHMVHMIVGFMGRQNAGGSSHEHGTGSHSDDVPQQRVSEHSSER